MKRLPLAPITVFSLISVVSVAFASNWERETLNDPDSQVQVWTRTVPESDFKAFRGVVTIQAAIPTLLAIIRDTKHVPEWYYRTKEARQLKRINRYQSLNYAVTSAPWPVSDRDSVTLATYSENADGSVVIKLEAKPYAYPEKPGRVRIPVLEGFWKLEPIGEQNTRLTLQVRSEPGGRIPSWLMNTMVVEMPQYSLSALKKRAEARQESR